MGKEEKIIWTLLLSRDHRDKGPGTLAAMLVESTWRGWKSLFHILEQHNYLHTSEVVGPVVVHKRDDTEVRNKRVVKALGRWKIESNSHILEIVNNTIDKTHNIPENNAVRKKATLPEGHILHLHIYD